jgi:hypothetical protein
MAAASSSSSSSSAKRTKVAEDERDQVETYEVVARARAGANIAGLEAYNAMYAKSVADPDSFWREHANRFVAWSHPFDEVCGGSFEDGDVRWFSGELLRRFLAISSAPSSYLALIFNCTDTRCWRK